MFASDKDWNCPVCGSGVKDQEGGGLPLSLSFGPKKGGVGNVGEWPRMEGGGIMCGEGAAGQPLTGCPTGGRLGCYLAGGHLTWQYRAGGGYAGMEVWWGPVHLTA